MKLSDRMSMLSNHALALILMIHLLGEISHLQVGYMLFFMDIIQKTLLELHYNKTTTSPQQNNMT